MMAANTSLRRPGQTSVEVDEIDGFQFMSFERIEEAQKYLKHPVQSCRQTPNTQPSRGNIKPAKTGAKTSNKSAKKPKVGGSSSSAVRPGVSKAKPAGAKKVPVWLKHKRRLRKGDKRVIVNKFHKFVFVSAFTLDDFDVYEEEIARQVSPGVKRKVSPSTQTRSPLLSGEKRFKRSTEELDDTRDLVTSSLLFSGGIARPAGKSGTISTSSSMSDLNQLVSFTSSIVVPLNDDLLTASQASEPTRPGQDAAETSVQQKIKNRKKQYPHMQIDEVFDRSVSSPSGSESSVITISDDGPEQENIILDVINVDNESSSAQFIHDSIKMACANKPEETPMDKSLLSNKTNRDKAKRKKCRICCIYPSKIVEAKKIGPLFGSFYPSYTVSCVSTCKQHPPGEIIVQPSLSKPGYVDTCIQTNAPDIRMNLDFAHRFPHRTIAITTHCSRTTTQPSPRAKRDTFFNKSEHHRSSEQKRREQMHDQFTDLRKIITTSQAIPDNERASKQWILEHAMASITSLKAEAAVLEALKKTMAAKNERLKGKWKELSGREFDPNMNRCNIPSESSGQTKLIDLYKQYRKNVRRKKSSKINGVEQISVTPQPSITTSKNQSQAVVENRQLSGANTGKQSGQAMVTSKASLDHANNEQSHTLSKKLEQVVSVNTVSQDLAPGNVNHSSQAVVTSNPSQMTSLARPNHDAGTIMKRTSEAVIFTKPGEDSFAVATNPSKLDTNNPSQTVAVKPRQTITSTTPTNSNQSTSAGMPNRLNTPSIPVPVKLSSHPRAVSNPNPTTSISVRMPILATTTSFPPPSQLAPPGKVTSPCEAVNVNPAIAMRMPPGAIAVRMPSKAMNVAAQFIAVSQSSQLTGPRLLIPLSKLNKALLTRKPTQWTAMSKLSQQEVNKLHVENIGAVVEVGAGELDDKAKHKNDIVLLDVAQTEHKSASSEQDRTLSLIPTSSSINVTLKSVGSITSNKIFNKKPVPSKQKSLVGLQIDQTNRPALIPMPVHETYTSKQKTEANLTTGPAMFAEVPKISETLLADTFQDSRNVINNTNDTGLCVISSVFSLSNIECEGTLQPAVDPGNRSDSGEQLGRDVDVNCNSTTHDHNYFKSENNLLAGENTA